MKYRRFGKTGLQIPVISCGGMRFQQSWRRGDAVTEESQRNLEACVRRAFELGIHHFETARGYGTSEYQLGKVLPALPRGEIIVQTKVGADSDPKKFESNFEDSMRTLGLDYLDLFAFHGVNDEAGYDRVVRCLDTALRWKREGRIRFLGFSTHAPLDVILKTIGLGVFDYVNLHWYYIFQDNWPAVVEANARDMGVFIISPNDKGGMLYLPPARLVELTAPFHPMVFNGLFCLSRPEVHTLSCGVARPEDFDIHLETAELSDRAAEAVAPIAARLQEAMERAVGKEYLETWHLGLPEWHQTPGNVNIPTILRLRNLVLAYDMVAYAKMRYNLLGHGDDWFPGENGSKLDGADLSACLRDYPYADRVPQMLREMHALLGGKEVKRLQTE
mgnify:CR=1 FL=1